MNTSKRRFTDKDYSVFQGPRTRDNYEQTRISLQECMKKHSRKGSEQVESIDPDMEILGFHKYILTFLDYEFYNPIPQLIHKLIKVITLQSKRERDKTKCHPKNSK